MEYTEEMKNVHKWMKDNGKYVLHGKHECYQFSMAVVVEYAKHYHEQELIKMRQENDILDTNIRQH